MQGNPGKGKNTRQLETVCLLGGNEVSCGRNSGLVYDWVRNEAGEADDGIRSWKVLGSKLQN